MRLPMMRAVLLGATTSLAIMATAPAFAQEKITVWWVKGFYKAEDDALYAAIKKFEDQTKIKVDLSQYAVQDMIPKTVSALDAGTPPDVAYADSYDFQVTGKWAYEDKLADISDIINPIKDQFEPAALSTTDLYDDAAKKKAYYAFPLKQQTMHIEIWTDLLKKAGYTPKDLPKDWEGYWHFWCEKVQPGLRKATHKRDYATGFPMGVDSTDAFFSFLTFMDAYNVKLVDDNGKLTVDDPKVREGLIKAMTDYVYPYEKGCTPPSSTSWKDPDNNVAFNNKTIVMTHNATISIAAKWLDDMDNNTLSADVRAKAKQAFEHDILTTGFPNKPDGSKMVYRTAVKTGVIFKNAKNIADAKKFVSFLMKEENLRPYVEGSLGRWFPVTKAGQKSPFWDANVHRRSVRDQYASGVVPFEFTKNWKFTILNNENVWAKAMNRIVNEKVPVDKAVDEMIARIKQVAG